MCNKLYLRSRVLEATKAMPNLLEVLCKNIILASCPVLRPGKIILENKNLYNKSILYFNTQIITIQYMYLHRHKGFFLILFIVSKKHLDIFLSNLLSNSVQYKVNVF